MEVLEVSRLDPAGLDVAVHVGLLQADHAAELIGGQVALVDEPVEAAQGHAETRRRFLRAQPGDALRHHPDCPTVRCPRSPTAATVPARKAAISTPAVTAAVSARSTSGPSPTRRYPSASSAGLQPPSGP